MSLKVVSRPSRYVCKACRLTLGGNPKRKYGTSSITSNPKLDDIYDVVTVGGGPVGLALLAAIKSNPSTSHLKCALIEAQPLAKQKQWDLPQDQYSNRASSITPTNNSFLESTGAWRHLNLSRVQPYDEMQVWDAGNDTAIQFDWKAEAVRYNAPLRTVATMVENANLTRALLRRLDELNANDDLLSNNQHPATGKASSRQIAARLLIGADGINSPVRTFAGINTMGWDYSRHGVVATLKLEDTSRSQTASFSPESDLDSALEDFLSDDKPPNPTHTPENILPSNRATAYQRFLPTLGGPIAILPLPNNHASLVWSTTPETATYLKSLPAPALTATINAALRLTQVDLQYMLSLPSSSANSQHEQELNWRLPHTPAPPPTRPIPTILSIQPNSLRLLPLRLRNTTTYTLPRIALAGDAAHSIHPLAGQGLNLGLGDAEALARHIGRAVEHGGDIGDMMWLEGYGAERYARAVEMSGGVDLLNGVYQVGRGGGVVGGVMGRLRGLGMWAVGAVPGVKEGL